MARNKVVKCICHDKMFDEVKAYAEEHGISTVEELQKRNYCSNSCRLCMPYVEMMLKTGQTEFTPGEPFR
ncbi:MAG TPA: hypothetical protein VF181_04175 [Balneolaceae bacterium]